MKWNFAKNKKELETKQDIPQIIKVLLARRGVENEEGLRKFLNPKFSDLHDPFLLPNMKTALKRILEAKELNQKVIIYGDYDVDGVSSTSILWDFLYRKLRMNVTPFIPSRFNEGYGLNSDKLKELEKEGVDLVITVDCGVKDKELIERYPNMDFVITDHHTPPENTDFEGVKIVHPKLPGSKYPFKELCGTGVAWKLIHALIKELDIDEQIAANYLDFVALATVCDVMPLEDENRTLVKLGLERLNQTENIGMKSLLSRAGVHSEQITTYHLGYVIGPRINAMGRLDSALNAVRLFSTENSDSAFKLANRLDELNRERQSITETMVNEAFDQITTQINNDKELALLFVYSESWHEGVVGLVAGRLSERYHKPAIAATLIEGKVTGSARSPSGFDVTQAISKQSEYLIRYGGHAQAAGFSLDQNLLEKFQTALQDYAKEKLKSKDLEKVINIDAEIIPAEATMKLARWIEKLEPFGIANPKPNFLLKELKIISIQNFGKENDHVRLRLTDGKSDQAIFAIGFSLAQKMKKFSVGDRIDVVGNLEINRWKGSENLQLKIKDIKKSK